MGVYAVLNGIAAFTNGAYPTVENVVGPAGFLLGFVGLLGLYPTLADRSATVTRVGAGAAALGAAGFTAIAVVNVGVLAGVLPAEPPVLAAVLLAPIVIGMIPGFLAFGVASLRSDVHSTAVGLLLLAPPAIFAVMLAGAATGHASAWSAFAISAGQAFAHLAVGYVLRTEPAPAERGVRSAEATAS